VVVPVRAIGCQPNLRNPVHTTCWCRRMPAPDSGLLHELLQKTPVGRGLSTPSTMARASYAV
jgi:hypothetical protein